MLPFPFHFFMDDLTLLSPTPEPVPEALLIPPAERHNPFLVFALSLLFPGLGHFYVRLVARGFVIAFFQSVGILLITFASGALHLQGFLIVVSIYCFAALDAYFTARERNAGSTYGLHGKNPRVASVLNLITKGFGYFYLGDRVKGILCFLGIGTLQIVFAKSSSTWASIAGITVQIAIAVDVYRVARDRREQANPPELRSLIEQANYSPVPSWVPVAFVSLLAASAVFCFFALNILNTRYITAGGSFDNGPGGLIYTNPQQHLQFSTPAGWEPGRVPNALVEVSGRPFGDYCSLLIYDRYSSFSSVSVVKSLRMDMLKRHPAAYILSPRISIDGRDPETFSASFKNAEGADITQIFIVVRRRLNLFTFIETSSDLGCHRDFAAIESSLKF